MDVEVLARIQFAITIMFHYIYPPLSIGLGVVLVVIEGFYLKTGNEHYKTAAKFWTKVFALTFAVGVATGIVMEFEFGTNWARYSRYVGDVFGSALAAEGIFAFFLESGFLALLLFGWDRIGRKMHFFSTLMVCLGAHFSAVWIVVANSWMQTPAGYHIVGGELNERAEITDFWQMVFNPSSVERLFHVVVGTWLAGTFLVISVSAFYILKKRHIDFAKTSLKVGLSIAVISVILQGIAGDAAARTIAKHQPMKLAALEGVFHTTKGAPLSIWGIVNTQKERVDYAIEIPYLLSFLSFRNIDATVLGLNTVPKQDWPKTAFLFQIYRVMVGMWIIMAVAAFLGAFFWWRKTLFEKRWLLWILVFSVFAPQIANQVGWMCAEMGRYPWIVQDLLRISEAFSKSVAAGQVLGSIIMFGVVYSFLFILFIYLLNEKIQHGPDEYEAATPYHHGELYVQEVTHE